MLSNAALAAVFLAVAVMVIPGRLAVLARLAAVHPQPSVTDRARWSPRRLMTPRLLPLLAAGSVAAVVATDGRGPLLAPPIGIGVFFACRWLARRLPGAPRARAPDPLRLASAWDLLAACLRGGLSVPAAVRAIAVELPEPAAGPLLRTAELLALGADPVAAWEPALHQPLTAELARGARRTARSGAALAGVAEGLAVTVRSTADDAAEARAQRAAVAVAGPLGLCFLPAFLCIGVVPVVIGLASRLLASW